VAKTLLAVDDSTTMRKVLEITFAGEDFMVVGADGPRGALARLGEGPVAAVIDTSLEGEDGYALAKELRARDPRLAILLLASRYNPYDATRGRDAGVDDYADKPFDTQALIDKVKRAMVAREGAKVAPVPQHAYRGPGLTEPEVSAPVPPAPVPVPQPVPLAAAPRAPAPVPFPQRPVVPTQRTHTLSFEGSPVMPVQAPSPPIARTAPSGTPIIQAVPQNVPVAPPRISPPVQVTPITPAGSSEHTARTAVPPRPAEAVVAAANGQLANSLGELGLTTQQIEAVMALSREVIERVVWEVVPPLAEALIKQEITRLTKEG
jgi:CheY-like chemotaxis protein